jgi:hypothetical protein
MKYFCVCLIFLFLKGQSQNPYLVDAGFENLPLGANTSTAWLSSVADATGITGLYCGNNNAYTYTNSTTSVSTTPIQDSRCYNVSQSPFGGNKVIVLNQTAPNLGGSLRTKLTQNFQVTNSAFIYKYAYKGVLDNGHMVCNAGILVFNFYDCGNNLISALSRTINASGSNSLYNPDLAYWAVGAPNTPTSAINNGISYTPNWVMHSVNLFPYIGTCVTVEVVASPCICGGWGAYCYYDSECDNNMIETGGYTFPTTNSYVTCGASTTLSGTPGFSSYLWQGPVNSGIAGLTTQAITASVTGNYSLTVTTGTVSLNTIINLSIGSAAPIATVTSSSPTVCLGGTVTLQASGSISNTYTWSTGSNATLIAVSPTINTFYSVVVTNSLGCLAYDSKLVTMAPSPQLVQIISPVLNVCPVQSTILTANGNANTSYTWSTGSNNPSLTVSPLGVTVYSVSATNTLGCVSSASKTIGVYPTATIQIASSSTVVCFNQPVSLSLGSQGISSYTWSTGIANQSLSLTPSSTAVYSLVGTDPNGCNTSIATADVVVLPLPAIQASASSTALCIGQSASLIATSSPLSTYYWSTGSASATTAATPSSTTVYQVTVTDTFGCSSTATVPITVFPLPQAGIQAPDEICEGESVILQITSQSLASYSWSTGGTGPTITVTPTGAAIYSVAVINNAGCMATSQKFIDVTFCTGIKPYNISDKQLIVFPNPTNGEFVIKGYGNKNGLIFNAVGQKIAEFDLVFENNFSQNFSDFVPGIYFIRTQSSSIKMVIK